jgi:hypothetical protein
MFKISLDGKLKAELPANLNNDDFLKVLRIYLFNEEFQGWNKFEVKKE